MAELLEYSLVLMASTLFVAGSVLVYGGYASFESGLSLRSAFDSVSRLAETSIADGSATATMTLPPSTIECRSGVLGVRVANSELNETLPVWCGFSVSVSGGVHTVSFSYASSQLELAVT